MVNLRSPLFFFPLIVGASLNAGLSAYLRLVHPKGFPRLDDAAGDSGDGALGKIIDGHPLFSANARKFYIKVQAA